MLIAAALYPELVDGIALICPGLLPRVGVSRKEKLQIAWAMFTNRRKLFPIPLSDPLLFTANPEAQAFIASDPLGLRQGTAGLLAASFLIDRRLKHVSARIKQPALLMLAGQDRIVDNRRTLAYFQRLATADRQLIEYPEGHHTLEFDPDPTRYARDLISWVEAHVIADTASARRRFGRAVECVRAAMEQHQLFQDFGSGRLGRLLGCHVAVRRSAFPGRLRRLGVAGFVGWTGVALLGIERKR